MLVTITNDVVENNDIDDSEIKYLRDFRIERRHELVIRIDFLLQLRQSFNYVPIVNLLEIIAFEFLGLGLLAVGAHLSLLAFTPFVDRCKELVSLCQ